MKKVFIAVFAAAITLACYAKSEIQPFMNFKFSLVNAKTFNEPTPVWLTTTTTGGNPNRRTGTFKASPELGTEGTYVMNIIYTGQAFHCTTIFSPKSGGSFTTQSNCEKTNFDGQWRVIGGTGIYSDLHANGSIEMVPGHEYCIGKVF